MKQCHVTIQGYVQGVGFRQFVKKQAEKLHITGWVRNDENGSVEALLQAAGKDVQEETVALETLLTACRQGPLLAEVRDVVVTWMDEEEMDPYPTFDVVE